MAHIPGNVQARDRRGTAADGYTAVVDEQDTIERAGHASLEPQHIGPLHHIFYRGRVLRAGWGLLLAIAIGGALQWVQIAIVQLIHPLASIFAAIANRTLPLSWVLFNLCVLVSVVVTTAIMAYFEQRHMQDFGFLGRRFVRLFLGGAFSGALLMCGLLFLLHRWDYAIFHGQVLFGTRAEWQAGIDWAIFFLLAAFVEQAITQGYLLYNLTRGLSTVLRRYFGATLGVNAAFWIGALLLTPVFVLLHAANRGESRIGLWAAAAYGLMLAFSLWRTGSVWWAIGFHLAWDWTQGFVFGTADSGLYPTSHLFLTESNGPAEWSGGATGPEGSLLAFAAYLAGALLLLLVFRRKRKVYPELWTEAERQARLQAATTLPDPG